MAAYSGEASCYSHFYESSLKYGRVDVVIDGAIQDSPNLEVFWQARLNSVRDDEIQDLPEECPDTHGILKFELTYRNKAKKDRFGKSGNRQFLFLQFIDDDYIAPKDALVDYRYDHLVIANLLDKT